MTERKWKRHLVALGAALLLTSPADAQPVSDADLARADELYRQGNTAFDAGKMDDAFKLYREAFSIKQSYDIAGNLGAAELKLGMQREAAEHLSFSLRLFPANGKEKARKITQDALSEAKRKVGCFRVTVDTAGAKVMLGDRMVGTSPLPDVVCSYPAPTKLRVELLGYDAHEQEVTAELGVDKPVNVALKRSAGGVGGDGGAGAQGAGGSGAGGGTGGLGGSGGDDAVAEKPIWPAIVLGAAGAAGLAVGVAGVVVGAQKDGEASDLAAGPSCSPVVTPSCVAEGGELADDWATFNTVGIVGFSVGGAALIGMTVYLLIPSGKQTSASWQMMPWLDPETAGLTIGHNF